MFNGRLFAAWTGMPDDTRMFYSSYPDPPSITLSAIQDDGFFVNVTGQGFTHGGTVAVAYDRQAGGDTNTQSTDTVTADGSGAFVHGIAVHAMPLNSATVEATDSDSLESVTASLS